MCAQFLGNRILSSHENSKDFVDQCCWDYKSQFDVVFLRLSLFSAPSQVVKEPIVTQQESIRDLSSFASLTMCQFVKLSSQIHLEIIPHRLFIECGRYPFSPFILHSCWVDVLRTWRCLSLESVGSRRVEHTSYILDAHPTLHPSLSVVHHPACPQIALDVFYFA